MKLHSEVFLWGIIAGLAILAGMFYAQLHARLAPAAETVQIERPSLVSADAAGDKLTLIPTIAGDVSDLSPAVTGQDLVGGCQ